MSADVGPLFDGNVEKHLNDTDPLFSETDG
jgi:hypothetical protein